LDNSNIQIERDDWKQKFIIAKMKEFQVKKSLTRGTRKKYSLAWVYVVALDDALQLVRYAMRNIVDKFKIMSCHQSVNMVVKYFEQGPTISSGSDKTLLAQALFKYR
jgi:hypothetical protein